MKSSAWKLMSLARIVDDKVFRLIASVGALAAFALAPTRAIDGDTPQPRVTLGSRANALKVGPKMNASDKNLRGSEFIGQDLSGAMFDGSDLHGVLFRDCDLSNVSFRHADLTEAAFHACGRGLRGADFTDAIIAGLRSDSVSSLSPEQLQATHSYKVKDLQGCTISARDPANPEVRPAYDFRGAHLGGARLLYGDFRDCDFTFAEIDGIEIDSCKLTFAQLGSTKSFRAGVLRNMNFRFNIDGNPDFSGIDLSGTRLAIGRHTQYTNAIITDCIFRGMLRKEDLYTTKNYRHGRLSGIKFEYVDMSGWDLSRQNLTGCWFTACTFTGANFEDSVITGVVVQHELRKSIGLTVEQIKSTWNYKHGRMEGIRLPDELAEALREE